MTSVTSADSNTPGRLGPDDAGEILTLQRAAYVTEAQLHADVLLPPLTQSLEQLRAELALDTVIAFGYRDNGRLIASVRLQIDGDRAELRRTCVAPDRQGEGLGTALFALAEKMVPEHVSTITLFTGERSEGNLRLYRRLGYHETGRRSAGAYDLVYMAKQIR